MTENKKRLYGYLSAFVVGFIIGLCNSTFNLVSILWQLVLAGAAGVGANMVTRAVLDIRYPTKENDSCSSE